MILFIRDTNKDIEHPVCTCGANIACSRPRIGILNDVQRTNKYIDALTKVCAQSVSQICYTIDMQYLCLYARSFFT